MLRGMNTHKIEPTACKSGTREGLSHHLPLDSSFHTWTVCSSQETQDVKARNQRESSGNFLIESACEDDDPLSTKLFDFPDVGPWQPYIVPSTALSLQSQRSYLLSDPLTVGQPQLVNSQIFHQTNQQDSGVRSCKTSVMVSQSMFPLECYHHCSNNMENFTPEMPQAGSKRPFGNWFQGLVSEEDEEPLHKYCDRKSLTTSAETSERIWGKSFEAKDTKFWDADHCIKLQLTKPDSQLSNEQPKDFMGDVSTSRSNHIALGTGLTNKQRIQWTQELHEEFVKAVRCLGGAEKATPKEILKLMNLEGLTIYHIKSHLQKYRTAKHASTFIQGKGRMSTVEETPSADLNNGLHITEALCLQMDVQRSLHEQLEIQRNLQIRIEEHAKYLEKMFNEQNKRIISQNNQNSNIFTCSDDIEEHKFSGT